MTNLVNASKHYTKKAVILQPSLYEKGPGISTGP